MFKPNELERFSMIFEPQMKAAEERIMADVIRRLKINGEITRAADWQIHRAYELGLSKRKVSKIIQQEMGITYKQVKTMYRQVMQLGYSRDEKLYKYKGIAQVPFEKNEGLQQLISAVAEQTYENMQNITQSLGFAVRNDAGKLIFSPLADYYQQTLDAAMLDISSGAFDYNTVLKRVVRELTNSGLRTIDYATGWKNRVNVAARRAVMTGMSQLTAKVNEDNAEQLGTDQFEIEWHGGARPEHWWGGMVMSKKELISKCGLGTVTGLCGVNCYHDYYPFIPGISERSYTDEELEELNRKENTPVEYGGKTYTKYEATQRQRKLETTMRAQRERIALLKEGGADEQDIINARAQYRLTSAEYAKFSKAMDIPQQRERVYVDGLGNVGVGKITPAQDIPKIQPRGLGAKVSSKVTPAEREQLLRVPEGTKPLTNAINSGIILSNKSNQNIIGHEIEETLSRVDIKNGKRVLEEWPLKSYLLDDYSNIWSQTQSDDALAMAKYLDKNVNNGKYGTLNRIVIAKNTDLRGISSYNHITNTLYISEELITKEGFERIVDTSYFPARNLDDVITHELDGHKRHWDMVKKFYVDNLEKYSSLGDAKQDYERSLRSYIVKQQSSDYFYVSKTVSRNAEQAFIHDNSLNELVADCAVIQHNGEISDELLFKELKEIMNYDAKS